jgi:hypothetical protein
MLADPDARQAALHYEDRPRLCDVQGDLERTPLARMLKELLELAEAVDSKAAKIEGEYVQAGRRYLYRAEPEARLATQILNLFGPPEDCFVIREIAEREVERG